MSKSTIKKHSPDRLILTNIYVKESTGGWNWTGLETSITDERDRKEGTPTDDPLTAALNAMNIS